MWYSPRFRQKSEQLMRRESRTSGELLLPVSRRPSHWEMTSQRNNEALSRIPNRTSPWWFTWQTVALLLCYWILTHTMPWHRSSRLHCLSSARVTRPTTSAMNYQRSFTSCGSMSEAVNNKVRPDKDNHLGFTMYRKYKANSVILFRSIESCPTTCLLF